MKKIIYKSPIAILIIILFLSGCISLNSHQSGRTIGKDNNAFFGNLNYGKINIRQYSPFQDSSYFYIMEVGGVYGLTENIDLGFKMNTSFLMTGTSKFQFLGNKKSLFASSLGIDLGASPISALLLVISYSGSISSFNSVHLGKRLALTFTPRYMYLGFSNFSRDFSFTRENHILGYSTGFIFGQKHQFSFEISQYANNEQFTFSQQPQFSFGYIKRIFRKDR